MTYETVLLAFASDQAIAMSQNITQVDGDMEIVTAYIWMVYMMSLITEEYIGTAGEDIGTAGEDIGSAGEYIGTAGKYIGTAGQYIGTTGEDIGTAG